MTGARLVRVEGAAPGQAILDRAVRVLKSGGVVSHPTETVYGLAADPWNAGALERLNELKGRGAGAGYILITAGREGAARLTADPEPPHLAALARAFWPGPLTLVVPASCEAPPGARGAGGGVALRETSDPIARALVEAFGAPLTSTSANRPGLEPARSAEEVLSTFGAAIDLVIDGGRREAARPSTILDLTGPVPRLLREGTIPASRIRSVLESAGGPA